MICLSGTQVFSSERAVLCVSLVFFGFYLLSFFTRWRHRVPLFANSDTIKNQRKNCGENKRRRSVHDRSVRRNSKTSGMLEKKIGCLWVERRWPSFQKSKFPRNYFRERKIDFGSYYYFEINSENLRCSIKFYFKSFSIRHCEEENYFLPIFFLAFFLPHFFPRRIYLSPTPSKLAFFVEIHCALD